MRGNPGVVFLILIVGFVMFCSTCSYADWHHDGNGQSNNGSWHGNSHGNNGGYHGGGHDRSYVGVDLAIWPGNYYYDPAYYPPDNGVLVAGTAVQTVVQQPVIVVEPPQTGDSASMIGQVDSITINIPNDHGTYTAVSLKRSGNGFIGPQGEYYEQFPTVAQLKLMYGK